MRSSMLAYTMYCCLVVPLVAFVPTQPQCVASLRVAPQCRVPALAMVARPQKGEAGYKRAAVKHFLRKTFRPGVVRAEEEAEREAIEKAAREARRAQAIKED